jgi:glycosyltransferase involved in cell wall biosynthesis
MIQKMAEHFSSNITWELITPSYPYTPLLGKSMTVREKLIGRMLPLVTDPSMSEIMSTFDPDVVYSDSPLYGAQFKAYSYLRGKAPPLIVHLRGDWWREYSEWFRCATWRQRAISSQSYAYHWASIILAKKVTPICKWLERIVKHYSPSKNTEVVYQGIDTAQFQSESGLELQHPAVAIIQNHTVYPKVAGLLNFSTVIEKVPEVQFYIAEGENVKQTFLPLVKKQFSSLPNVHYIKGVDNAREVCRMLTAADCYVLASGLDCCPTTVLEASLLCKPVIASRVGGVPEIVVEGQTGWTIQNDRTADWVDKIRCVTTDSKLNRRLGDYGRRWVSGKFDWAKISKQVESLLHAEAG